MRTYEIVLTKRYIIKSNQPKSEIETNVGDFIDDEQLRTDLLNYKVEDIFDVSVRRINEPEEIPCLVCGNPITAIELEENGQCCDDCFGDNDEEES